MGDKAFYAGYALHDVGAAFREEYQADDLARLAVPTVVVYGTRSPAVTTRIARAVAEGVAQGRLATIEGGAHAMLATHAEQVVETIAGFALGPREDSESADLGHASHRRRGHPGCSWCVWGCLGPPSRLDKWR